MCYDVNGIMGVELARILSEVPVNIRSADNIDKFRSMLNDGDFAPNAIVWTVSVKNLADFDTLGEIKAPCPIVVVSDFTDKKYVIKAIENGADDYISRPYEDNVVLKKLEKALNLPDGHVPEENFDDFLVINFDEMLSRELSAAARGNYKLSVIMITLLDENIDYDEVTRLMRFIMQSRLRNTDSVFRLGMDRIVAILPFTDVEGRKVVSQKLEKFFNEHSLIRKLGGPFNFQFSEVTYPDDGKVKTNLLKLLEERQNGGSL